MVEIVESFFSSIDFRTKKTEKNGEYSIAATGTDDDGSYGRIDAKVFVEGERIVVELTAGENAFLKLSSLTSLIFGGYPTLQALKSEGILRKIEPDFYSYLAKRIESLKS
jgi:hypothetical protein